MRTNEHLTNRKTHSNGGEPLKEIKGGLRVTFLRVIRY